MYVDCDYPFVLLIHVPTSLIDGKCSWLEFHQMIKLIFPNSFHHLDIAERPMTAHAGSFSTHGDSHSARTDSAHEQITEKPSSFFCSAIPSSEM